MESQVRARGDEAWSDRLIYPNGWSVISLTRAAAKFDDRGLPERVAAPPGCAALVVLLVLVVVANTLLHGLFL
jgi:hypothetical protein